MAVALLAMPERLLVSFFGGSDGPWTVERMAAVTGAGLPEVDSLAVGEGPSAPAESTVWTLRGVSSNERYVERHERTALVGRQEGLGRSEASCAALIPITKHSRSWEPTHDDRRSIFAERSRHSFPKLAIRRPPEVKAATPDSVRSRRRLATRPYSTPEWPDELGPGWHSRCDVPLGA